MPVLKQKSIKPARNIPYAEGILMYNGTGASISANTIVRVDFSAGLQGGGLRVAVAASDSDRTGGKVPLFVTKHGIPAAKHGVVLPWAILQNQNTGGLSAGDTVYLNDVATGAGGWSGTKIVGAVDRSVGVILSVSATTGVVWLCPANFSYGTD